MLRSLLAALVLAALTSKAPAQVVQAPPVVDDLAYLSAGTAEDVQMRQYQRLYKKALDTGKPLVVVVGEQPVNVPPDYLVYLSTWFDGDTTVRVELGVPVDGTLWRHKMPSNRTALQIRQAVAKVKAEGKVQPTQASPFYDLLLSASLYPLHQPEEAADDEPTAAGQQPVRPWSSGVPYLDGLVHYQPTRLTQSIAVRDNVPVQDLVPRTALLPKWQVPGGMEGIRGWKSDLYKLVPYRYKWLGRIPVATSLGTVQHELGYKQEYPNGTVFMDVLSNAKTGKVFEHRVREKAGGTWYSYVAFRDRSQNPPGYHGLKQQCVECHREAGTGSYGVGLVPGGDTVLSDRLLD